MQKFSVERDGSLKDDDENYENCSCFDCQSSAG